MTLDLDRLEALAKAAESGLPGDRIQFALAVWDRAVILALIAEIRALRRQSLELLGVVIDVEQGGGFDDACLATIKRVMNILAGKEKA